MNEQESDVTGLGQGLHEAVSRDTVQCIRAACPTAQLRASLACQRHSTSEMTANAGQIFLLCPVLGLYGRPCPKILQFSESR